MQLNPNFLKAMDVKKTKPMTLYKYIVMGF